MYETKSKLNKPTNSQFKPPIMTRMKATISNTVNLFMVKKLMINNSIDLNLIILLLQNLFYKSY